MPRPRPARHDRPWRNRRAEDGHDRIADELHDRAILLEDRAVHRRTVLVELAGQHARVGVLGDRRVPTDVGHQHGDGQLLGVPGRAALFEDLRCDAAGEEPVERLALLLAVDDRLLEHLEPVEAVGSSGRRDLRRAWRRAPRPTR